MSAPTFEGDEEQPSPASDAAECHGVIENRSGIEGLCVLYSLGSLHYRVRLRPVNPLDSETFDRGDAWTVYEWARVETPDEDAEAIEWEEILWVPEVVREAIPGVVQVPDRPRHVQ